MEDTVTESRDAPGNDGRDDDSNNHRHAAIGADSAKNLSGNHDRGPKVAMYATGRLPTIAPNTAQRQESRKGK
ncbi:hypothetical protein KC338_g258 [Hortaea werneckii]|nr:hypothetical protein KC338_g258 [Hortaea werneckii]